MDKGDTLLIKRVHEATEAGIKAIHKSLAASAKQAKEIEGDVINLFSNAIINLLFDGEQIIVGQVKTKDPEGAQKFKYNFYEAVLKGIIERDGLREVKEPVVGLNPEIKQEVN